MASYLPRQERVQPWESTPPKPGNRAPIQFPTVRSGSRRDFSGHWSGDPEFQTPVLAHATEFIKRNVGNYLLYKGVYERGTQQIVKGEKDIMEAITHPTDPNHGALAKLPAPGAAPTCVEGLFHKTDPNYTDPEPTKKQPAPAPGGVAGLFHNTDPEYTESRRPMKDQPGPNPAKRRTTVGMAHDARMRWRANMPTSE